MAPIKNIHRSRRISMLTAMLLFWMFLILLMIACNFVLYTRFSPPPHRLQKPLAVPRNQLSETTTPVAAPSTDALHDFSGKHPILALSNDDYTRTPVHVLISPAYGQVGGSGTCENDFGKGLVDRWRSSKEEWCVPSGSAQGTEHGEFALGSRVHCFLVQQTGHSGAGDNLCILQDVLFDFQDLRDTSVIAKVMQSYADSRHEILPYIPWKKGTVRGSCKRRTDRWTSRFFPGWNRDLMMSFEEVHPDQAQVQGDASVSWTEPLFCGTRERKTSFMVQRDTFANFFHNSEDFFNLFLALAILEMPLDGIQVLFLDLFPKGPFWPLWTAVFGREENVFLAWDMIEQYGNRTVCFDTAVLTIIGPAAPITLHTATTGCHNSPLLKAYADMIIRGMNLQPKATCVSSPRPSPRVVVTWMSRLSSVRWPERAFCDGKFFSCSYFQHLGVRTIGRVVVNDADCVAKLKELETYQGYSDAKRVVFQARDYNRLNLVQQLEDSVQTDVMIGPHGAGLMHNVFMSDRAQLVEISVDGSGGLRHFENLNSWRRNPQNYHGWQGASNPVDTQRLWSIALQAVEAVDISAY